MRQIFVRFWPILVILFLWFIFASPYFLKGNVPYSSTYQVNFFAPWSHYDQLHGPVKNNAMPDVHSQIYPWKKFTINTLQAGQVPFWNPDMFAGNPHLANYQSAVLSPFNILFFLFSFIDAWSILVLLQPLLAALSMYLFIRSIKVGKGASLLGSISFMFCGFMVVWMAYATLGYAILFLPLSFYAIEKYSQQQKTRFLILLVSTVPLSFFSGHFQISIYFFIAALSYIIYKYFIDRSFKKTLLLVGALCLGIVLALPQLLPSLILYKESVRSEIFMISEAIPLQYLITIISPDFFGNAVTRNDWFGHYAEWAGFIGIVPFVLSLYNIYGKKRTSLFFYILGIVALILAVNNPISPLIVSLKIPVISTSALSRIIVLFSFAFSVLAAIGAANVIDLIKKREEKKIIAVLVGFFVLFSLLWVALFVAKPLPLDKLIIAKRNIVLPTIIFIVFSASILCTLKQKKFLPLLPFLLLLLVSFDSLRFAQKWMPFDPRGLAYPSVPVTSAIQKNIGQGRIFGNLGGEFLMYYGIPGIEGYDPLYIRRYGEFIQAASRGSFEQAQRSVVKLDRNGIYTDRALDLLGVSLIFHPIADTNQGWAYPVWNNPQRFSVVYHDDKFQLFKNNTAMDRAVIFFSYEVINKQEDIIKRLYGKNFDFRKTVILEEVPMGIQPEVDKNHNGTVKIVSYAPDKVVIDVSTDSPGVLFLSDNFYPAWIAKVNGKPAKIYRADYTFRSVVVPKGKSTVEFIYENWLL